MPPPLPGSTGWKGKLEHPRKEESFSNKSQFLTDPSAMVQLFYGRDKWIVCSFLCHFGVFFLLQAHGATHPEDVAALKAFLSGIEDPSGSLRNWKGEDPCGHDQWEGIVCSPPMDGNNRVTELRLLDHKLSGHLVPELGSLESLQILDLMWNRISGSIPKELGNLKQLALLLLNGNDLTGTIPEELGNLRFLDRLQIDSNRISGSIPTTFQNLVSMRHLHMNNNSLSGSIPKELGQLRNLVYFLVDANHLTGNIPSELSNISTLQILQLDDNDFTSASIPQAFGGMSNLMKLSIRNANLRGEIPDLSHMLKLEYLDLSENQLEGEIPSKLPKNLTTIDFSSNRLQGNIPDIFSNLPKLQLFALRNNNLSGSALPSTFQTSVPVTSSQNQVLLDFQNNSLSSIPTGLLNFLTMRPNLYVWLHNNHEICLANDTNLRRICRSHHEKFYPESKGDNKEYSPTCDPMTCSPGEEPIPSIFYNQGMCRCAMPIVVGYRLKSPSFSFFTPFIKDYEQWIAKCTLLSRDQVHLDSFTKEPGPRFATVLKLFPGDGRRVFSENEVLRIFSIFDGWKMPPDDFYGPQELMFFNYTLFQGDLGTHSSSHGHGWKGLLPILLSSIVGTMTIIGAIALFLFLRHGHKMGTCRPTRSYGNKANKERLLKVNGVKAFSFKELAMATKNFHDEMIVGQGGYGRVYKGILGDGNAVAIKRAKECSRQGQEEFHTEIELLSRVHHRNLVSLLGYCVDNDEQMLVYEYMPNGTLKDHLAQGAITSDNSLSSNNMALDFASRLQIAIGAARGIYYLHVEANPPIFHRDIKSSNILLDAHNTPKVADFGLSRLAPTLEFDGLPNDYVSTVVKGTPGYLDPEYFLTHKLTNKSDVYSFGVVLLELFTGMQPIFNGKNIVREVKLAFENDTLLEHIDAQMGSFRPEALAALVRLALACCSDDTTTRPLINDVVHDLENIWNIVQGPNTTPRCDLHSYSSNSSKSKSTYDTLVKHPYLSSDGGSSEIMRQDIEDRVTPR